MVTLSEVWTHLTKGAAAPEALSQVAIRTISADPRHTGAACLLVVCPDRASPDLVTQAIDRGTVGLITEGQMSEDHRITWWDTKFGDDGKSKLPAGGRVAGLIVPDARQALLSLAGFWRSKIPSSVVCIMGAEGLRTAQRMAAAVLSQRFKTIAPDFLCCDPHSLAEGLLTAHVETERLLLRVSPQTAESLDFLRSVVLPNVVSINNTFPRAKYGDVTPSGPPHDKNLWLDAFLSGGLAPGAALVVNADDPAFQVSLAATLGRPNQVFSYGLWPESGRTLWTSGIENEGREGLRLRMHFMREVVYVRVPLLGRYSVHTALAASAIGLISQQPWEQIVAGLKTLTAQLQLIMTPGYNGASILEDSYAASPASTLSILNLLEDFPERKVAVVGDMTDTADHESEGHKKVGNRVSDVASCFVALGRFRHLMAREAIDCGMPTDAVYVASDNHDAVEKLRGMIVPKDIVLVSGSGRLHLKEIVDELIDTHAAICEV
jgi:UDP-N-acetylmuramoyl-tripeptide--D-alanyl-D-alanine ligase